MYTVEGSAIWLVVRSNLDAQYQGDRNDRQHGEQAETDIQRNFGILQTTKTPIGQSANADAHKVHDTVAGGAVIGSDDLREDRHVVAVEKPPAQAKEN